jgi:hypothetical protein
MPVARERLYRWVPAISMLLVSLISYIDRTTLAWCSEKRILAQPVLAVDP